MKSNVLLKGQLLRDIIAQEPTDIKSVELTRHEWNLFRPTIKDLQVYGLWYDVSEYHNHLLVRIRVNEIVEKYLQSILDNFNRQPDIYTP